MPSIDLYLDIPDLPLIEEFLNDEADIVFVVASGDGTFTTVGSTKLEPNSDYTLWHVPSGEIPTDCRDDQGRIVVDPSRGVHPGAILLQLEVCPGKYQQLVPGAEAGKYDLKLFTDPTAIGRSGFRWEGNKFKPIGKGAHPSTLRWWRRLQRWISKHGHKVTWDGPLEEPKEELRAWAFPFAYAALKNGRPRSLNPVLWAKGKRESSMADVLRIAREDAQAVYGDLSGFKITLISRPDGWHVDYLSTDPLAAGRGPHYVIDAKTGEILSKRYEQ